MYVVMAKRERESEREKKDHENFCCATLASLAGVVVDGGGWFLMAAVGRRKGRASRAEAYVCSCFLMISSHSARLVCINGIVGYRRG